MEVRKNHVPWNKGLTKEIDNRVAISDIARQKMRINRKDLWKNSLYREKMLKINKERLKKLNADPAFQKKRLEGFRKPESIKKIGDASRNRKFTEEHKMKLSISNKMHSNATRKKMIDMWKDPVYLEKMKSRPTACNKRHDVWNDSENIITYYLSGYDGYSLARKYNCSVSIIYKILKGKKVKIRPNVIQDQKMYSEKRMKGLIKTPNKPEQKLANILQLHFPTEWKFVGDGSFILGGKNPDFMNVNGQKKLIELWGDYWHKKFTTRAEDYYIPEKRIEFFKQFGFDTLIIWESELKNQETLTNMLQEFNGR